MIAETTPAVCTQTKPNAVGTNSTICCKHMAYLKTSLKTNWSFCPKRTAGDANPPRDTGWPAMARVAPTFRSACRANARRYSPRGSGEGSLRFPSNPAHQTKHCRNELYDLLQPQDLNRSSHQNELVLLPRTNRSLAYTNRTGQPAPSTNQPLTRRASAGENAGARHPLPTGEGCYGAAGEATLPPRRRRSSSRRSGSVDGRGGGAAGAGFLHEEHEGNHGQEGHAEQPEAVRIGKHAGLAEQIAVDEAVRLVEGLHGV